NRENPVTPPNADHHARHNMPKFRSPLTPPQMSSFKDEDFHQDYSGVETKRVPHAKRRLITQELSPPSRCSIDSFPEYDSSPFSPGRKM
ncbi:hypothetical protein MKW92_041763, partial [Papaver armeniacum]